MIKVLELFGGIGACTKALEKLGVEFEIADYVEIDNYAVGSYNAMHNFHFTPQDITKWDKQLDVDLIMHGSPCQDFSLAGAQAGADEGSGTRSSLMYETIRIVEKLHPKYIIWENVKNMLSEKHKHNFKNYLTKMDELGYINYFKVLNSKNYGIPQNRERVFTISIRKDINHGFEFPEEIPLELTLKDLLEPKVDDKYFLSDKMKQYVLSSGTKNFYYKPEIDLDIAKPLTSSMVKMHRAGTDNYVSERYVPIKNANKKGYEEAYEGDSVCLQYPNSKTRRGRVIHKMASTVQTKPNLGTISPDLKLRRLTPL